MSNIVIGIIAGSIVALISFILGLFGNIWYARYQENRQRQNKALKKHFTDLEKQYIKPTSEFLSNISNREGVLTYTNVEAQYSIDAIQTSWPMNNLNQDFICFKEHFSTEASEISGLREQIVINNTNNKSFNKELENLLEKRYHIPVKDYFKKSQLEKPFFSHSILSFFRLSYNEITEIVQGLREKNEFIFDFRQASLTRKEDNHWLLQLEGRELAQVTSKAEAELCKRALIELMETADLQVKGQNLYREAETLKDKARNLSSGLDLVCEQFGQYGKLLKRKRTCPACKLIFE